MTAPMLSNGVVDLSHYEKFDPHDWKTAYDAAVFGAINKATQGTRIVDDSYPLYTRQARAAGILTGAYLFGEGEHGAEYGSPKDQAKKFLDTVQPDDETLLAVDWEPNRYGPTMTLAEVEACAEELLLARPRKALLLYTGQLAKEALTPCGRPEVKSDVLAELELWLSHYTLAPAPVWPTLTWPTWKLWQWTDGTMVPPGHLTPGLGRVDVSHFNGDLEALRRLWGVSTDLSC